jgi:MYXO-CTERM domain-containing protein
MGQNLAICSGVLLAPNLVATARHCVSQLASTRIDCSTSNFVSTLPASDMFVTTNPNIATANMKTDFISVIGGDSGDDGIIVPPLPGVCGNDLALLILSQSIDLPQYVTPIIAPPMTDHQAYTTAFTAIGYGVDSPTDTTGSTAGVRRVREDINIACIPNDPSDNCYSDPSASQFIAASEFEGGDGTCEGDSGSGAFDQGSYNNGVWAAFGVLSRGGVSAEGGTCEGSIYTRFDAWGSLIVDAANKAAALGGYPAPGWANPSSPASDASISVGIPPATCTQNDAVCGQDSECCSFNCIISSDQVTAYCRACDPVNNCSHGYGCQEGVCVFGAANNYGTMASTVGVKSGCSVDSAPGSRAFPGQGFAVGLVAVGAGMTRRRRKTKGPASVRAR